MKLQKYLKPLKNLSRPIVVRRIHGHSMMPTLPPGTYVFARQWFKKIRPGNVVIFIHEGKEKIKRVEQVVENKIYLIGDHQEASTDSRHFGWLEREAVKAKLFWPMSGNVRELLNKKLML